MTDNDREEVEDMIWRAVSRAIDDIRNENADEIRRLEIEMENLRGEVEQ